jgi:hypothetical protein
MVRQQHLLAMLNASRLNDHRHAKINSKAEPNGMVIGNNLYQVTKGKFDDDGKYRVRKRIVRWYTRNFFGMHSKQNQRCQR